MESGQEWVSHTSIAAGRAGRGRRWQQPGTGRCGAAGPALAPPGGQRGARGRELHLAPAGRAPRELLRRAQPTRPARRWPAGAPPPSQRCGWPTRTWARRWTSCPTPATSSPACCWCPWPGPGRHRRGHSRAGSAAAPPAAPL